VGVKSLLSACDLTVMALDD